MFPFSLRPTLLPSRKSRGFRGRAPAAVAADALEDRTLLSAVVAENGTNSYDLETGETLCVPSSFTGSLSVSAAGDNLVRVEVGASVGSVQVMGDGAVSLVFQDGTSAGDVTFTAGGSGRSALLVGPMATVGGVTFTGASGDDVLRIEDGAETGTVSFVGNGGGDQMIVSGTVGSSLSIDGGSGDDRVDVRESGELTGDTSGTFGSGDDELRVFGATVGNVDVNFNAGDDLVLVRSGSTIDGNLSLVGGNDADTIRLFGGDIEVIGNMTVAGSGGDDVVQLTGLTLEGNQTVRMGQSGDSRDRLFVGDDEIVGDSNVSWQGDIQIIERDSRDIQSDYKLAGGSNSGTAMIDLTQGSEVGGNFELQNAGPTRMRAQLSVDMGNATVTTQGGRDHIQFEGGTRIEGNLNITTAGGDDVVRLVKGEVEVIGNGSISLGGGADEYRSEELFLDGNLSVTLAGAPDSGRDNVFLGEDEITGDLSIGWGGKAIVRGNGPLTVGSSLKLDGSASESAVRLPEGEVGSNITLTNAGQLFATLGLTTETGNVSVTGGSRADDIDLSGLTMNGGGNLSVSTAGGNDIVALTDAVIAGNASVSLGAGNDELDNATATVEGTATYTGGAGNDTITDPNSGMVSGFEN